MILCEAYLHDGFRAGDPVEDANPRLLWRGFEPLLLAKLPGAARIVPPSWEPLYAGEARRAFLRAQGYAPLESRAFVKPLPPGG